jgi:hypothetical protein
MPTTDTPQASKNIPLALQSLFYNLQYNDMSVSTKNLTKSFGWDANESFMQVRHVTVVKDGTRSVSICLFGDVVTPAGRNGRVPSGVLRCW